MTPALRRVGAVGAPVVVIDDFSGTLAETIELAAALAPYGRSAGSYYPGLRRIVTEADAAAFGYVQRTLQAAAPFIGGGFDAEGFDLIEASFSMVTARPEALAPAQRAPHFDSVDPRYLAVLHYLTDMPATGTAFYRQRTTGIERIDRGNVDRFIATARRESSAAQGYIAGSDPHFEQLAAIEAVPDRLIIYQGALLHSGIIPPGMSFSNDPRRGRLTANFFIQARSA